MTPLRHVARFVAPILYAAGLVPVMIGAVMVVSYTAYRIGFENLTTFRYNGDVAGVASIVVIGGFVFGFLGQTLLWLEPLRMPTFRDRLRRFAVLYVLMGTPGAWLVVTHKDLAAHGVAFGNGLAVAGLFSAGYEVLIDALLLLHRVRCSDRASSGDLA